MTAGDRGLRHGFAFGPAGARALSAEAADAPPAADERFRWLHAELGGEAALAWLRARAGFDPTALRAAATPRARPRMSHFGDALLLVLRAANSRKLGERGELASLRVLVGPRLVLTLGRVRLAAAERAAEQVRAGQAPREPAELLALLVNETAEGLHEVLEEIGGRLDEVELRVADPKRTPDRTEIFDLRRRLIGLCKWLTPQRDALERLYREPHPALGPHQRTLLREPAHRVARIAEEMEAARERAALLMEETGFQSAEELNRRIYVFTVIAGLFLPLTFLASLLGMNLAGIPGAGSPYAFPAVCAGMAALGAGIWLVLRRFRWL